MPTATLVEKTITVQFRNEPKDGKKGRYGSIKADGQLYLVQEDIWRTIEQGRTYKIKYQKPDGDFPPWIKSVETEDSKPLTPPVREAGTGSVTKTNGNYTRPVTSDKDSERIFICGLINAWARAGALNIDEENCKHAVRIARRVYIATLGNDMDGDEVGF